MNQSKETPAHLPHSHPQKDCTCGCHPHDSKTHPHHHTQVSFPSTLDLSTLQQNILLGLSQRKYLPVAQLTLSSTKDKSLYSIALAPVYLADAQDSMEEIKALGIELKQLQQSGLITLDYDLPLGGYSYQEYENSAIYRHFIETVKQSATHPEFLFDIPALEKGSMALTTKGENLIADLI